MKKKGFIIIFVLLAITTKVYSQSVVKAFSNINFKESIETVTEKIKINENLELNDWSSGKDSLSGTVYFSMPDGRYRHSIYFYFYNDMLYEVRIDSPRQWASWFDSITVPFRNNFVNMITAQYGSPSRFIKRDYSDLKLGYIVWSHIWDAEDSNEEKEIKIGYSDSSYSYENCAVLQIRYLPLASEKEKADEKLKSDLLESQSGLF